MAIIEMNGARLEGIKLVIFDKDGTLIDIHLYWGQMVQHRAELISQKLGLSNEDVYGLAYAMGMDLKKMKIKPDGPVGIKKRQIVMQAALDYLESIGMDGNEQLCKDIFNEVDRLSLERLKKLIHPLKGLYKMFEELEKTGCAVAIATTDLTQRAEVAMKQLGILEKIRVVVGADMVSKTKPDPEMVHIILNKLGIPANETIMVGDATTDVQMGISAGLRASVGVLSGLTNRSNLEQVTPYVINDISEIGIRA